MYYLAQGLRTSNEDRKMYWGVHPVMHDYEVEAVNHSSNNDSPHGSNSV